MQTLYNPTPEMWEEICERNTPNDDAIADRVMDIVNHVREKGDEALRHYAQLFDDTTLTSLMLSDAEIQDAEACVSAEVKQAIEVAIQNITKFHSAQRTEGVDIYTQEGVRCMQRCVPIQRVGLYIPGGGAPLFSTVLMLALPAQIAGCQEIVMCTPQGKDGKIAPEIVYAAQRCGVKSIFRVGGAQAIAAMAYGTDSVPKVDKIFGPGNRYVTKAKQFVTNNVAIDMPAGPSEVLVMADATAHAEFVAADMLSQAEHGADSQAMLVCDSADFAKAVEQAIAQQAKLLSRTASVEQSLSHSRIIVLPTRQEMISFANCYAAEHLIISMENPWDIAKQITAAGSVFIGNYSPESAGDYASGTNHTLPTSRWARSFSGVNLDSYMRKITYQELTEEGLKALAPTITTMATAEGLDAHAAAVTIRLR